MPRQPSRSTARPRSDAQENRFAILRATRDICGEHGDAFSVKQVAEKAGVSLATVYRHFDGKQALMDAVSVSRWKHLVELAQRPSNSTKHTLGVLDAYSYMCAADSAFLTALNIRPGFGEIAETMRVAFDPAFKNLWERAQARGQIRAGVDSVDVVNLTSSIQDMGRRQHMLKVLLAGIVTPSVQSAIPLEKLVASDKREYEQRLFSLI